MEALKFCRSDSNLTRCGRAEHLFLCQDGLCLEKGAAQAAYLSNIYDSGMEGMEWNRLYLNLECGGRLQIFLLAFDKMSGDCPLEVNGVPFQRQFAWLRENAVSVSHASDILLYGLKGRYFCFGFEALLPEEGTLFFRGYEISFPKQTFVEYLPQIYHNNPILERYLGILQTVWMENNRKIDGFSRRLSPNLTDEDTLRELARWVGADRWITGLPKEITVRLIKEACWLNSRRGTRTALSRFLELLTGEDAIIIEPFQWDALSPDTEEQRIYKELYGEDGSFTILLKKEPSIGRRRLRELLEDFLPIGTSCRLACLWEQQPIGGYCYLNVNAHITESPPPVLGSGFLRLGGVQLRSASMEKGDSEAFYRNSPEGV